MDVDRSRGRGDLEREAIFAYLVVDAGRKLTTTTVRPAGRGAVSATVGSEPELAAEIRTGACCDYSSAIRMDLAAAESNQIETE